MVLGDAVTKLQTIFNHVSRVKTWSLFYFRAPNLFEKSLAIHCFATGAKMGSRFEKFSEDDIWAINEVVVQTKTKKVTSYGLSVFTGR